MRTTLSKQQFLALGMIAVAIALFPLIEVTRTARAQPCVTNPGCQFSTTVPCSNATCVAFVVFPIPGATCSDGTMPQYYTTVSTNRWAECLPLAPPYANCTETLSQCAAVTLYMDSPCTIMSKCGSGSLDGCKATAGPACGP